MRLIDADKFKSYMQEKYLLFDHTLADIDAQPTVEAIPKEWIINWLTKQTIPALHTCDDYDAVNMMLDDWEKENGNI